MNRKPGFYWVKIDGQWMIGKFKTDSWYFCDPMMDFPGGHDGEDFDEIDENRIERGQVEALTAEREHWAKVAKDIAEVFDKKSCPPPPDYISDNPYLCKDE